MEGYKAEIIETSKELTPKERIKYKDLSDCIALDQALRDDAIIIEPVAYFILSVHNEHSKDSKDYKKYVVEDKNGARYTTGSESFWSSFMDIWEEMEDVDEEYMIKVSHKESKNYTGKNFITCSIV